VVRAVVDVEQIVKAFKEVVAGFTGLCIGDEDAEWEAMAEFCEAANIEDDELCEDLWDRITGIVDDIVKIRIEFDDEKLKKTVEEALKQRDQQKHEPVRIEGAKTMDELLDASIV